MCIRDRFDVALYLVKGNVLEDLDDAAFVEFENRQERDDDKLGRGRGTDELFEGAALATSHRAVNPLDMALHRNGHGGDVLGLEQKGVTSRRDIGADDGQPMQGDILEVLGHETQEALVGADKTRMHLRLVLHPRTQGRRDVLELLVHDETFDEDVARLLLSLIHIFASVMKKVVFALL